MEGYDHVIVGAGSAGCVLASRLSADPDVRVLLLEAGSAVPLPATAVPNRWSELLGSSADWGDTTTPQATGPSVAWSRGRGLGGTSAINGMVFARGHRSSYDGWVADGAVGWGFKDLLPFFQRTEHAVGRDPGVRGRGGPMVVAPAFPGHPLVTACLDAAAEAGHPVAADISSGLDEGFGRVDLNIVEGRRLSAADAYLAPVLDRPNLHVVTDALVHRLCVAGGRCTGVEYAVDGTRVQVASLREVVLCAGTTGSAQLLLLSGIGPADHLREVGVDVAVHLPGVGENLHDHVYVPVIYSPRQPVPPGDGNGIEALGLVRSAPGLPDPDLQLFFSAPMPVAFGDGYAVVAALATPHSRGRLRLVSADPGGRALIDPGYLTDDRDVDALVAGLRLAREIGRARALAPWRGAEVQPGGWVADEGAARAFVLANPSSYLHHVGSCRMGTDEMAVVDLDLRVRGVAGLRVADASVIPSIPSANTQPTVLAIAERAAELVIASS